MSIGIGKENAGFGVNRRMVLVGCRKETCLCMLLLSPVKIFLSGFDILFSIFANEILQYARRWIFDDTAFPLIPNCGCC